MTESPTPSAPAPGGQARRGPDGRAVPAGTDVLELDAPPLEDAPRLRQPDGPASGDREPGGSDGFTECKQFVVCL